MSDTPDLSKIVNLIMQNPHLISEIQALASTADSEEAEALPIADEVEKEAPKMGDSAPRVSKNEKRARLLSAMKPYLREERAKSIDTFLTIADMLDAVRSK